jgi:hypothetical protein
MSIETEASRETDTLPRFWYEPTHLPTDGDAPREIKEQWLGVRLPVTSEEFVVPPKALLPPDPDLHTTMAVVGAVEVDALQAISSLRLAGREEAADFWVAYFKAKGSTEDKEGSFTFRLNEGNLIDSATEELVEVSVIPFSQDETEAAGGQLRIEIE